MHNMLPCAHHLCHSLPSKHPPSSPYLWMLVWACHTHNVRHNGALTVHLPDLALRPTKAGKHTRHAQHAPMCTSFWSQSAIKTSPLKPIPNVARMGMPHSQCQTKWSSNCALAGFGVEAHQGSKIHKTCTTCPHVHIIYVTVCHLNIPPPAYT